MLDLMLLADIAEVLLLLGIFITLLVIAGRQKRD
jgi:hypothetical protein